MKRCSGVQHLLAAGDDRQKRPGLFDVPVAGNGFDGFTGEIGRNLWPQPIAKLRSALGVDLKINFAGQNNFDIA